MQAFTSRLYKEISQFNSDKTTRFKVTISPRRCTNGQQAQERCSTSLATKEMQGETTVRHCFTPVRMAAGERETTVWQTQGETPQPLSMEGM